MLLDEEKDKIKDTSSGENLLEALEEGEIDFQFRSLPLENSSMLNEDTILVDLNEDKMQIIHKSPTLLQP